MFELSPLVTATNAPASRMPAASMISRSKTIPTRVCPSNPGGRRSNACGFLSMTLTVCPCLVSDTVRSDSTRRHPAITTCIGAHPTRVRVACKSLPRALRTSLFELVRDAREDDARLEEESRLEPERGLVVEELVPPFRHDELGDHDRDDCVPRRLPDLPDQAQGRAGDLAVRRVDDLEGDVGAGLGPVVHDLR